LRVGAFLEDSAARRQIDAAATQRLAEELLHRFDAAAERVQLGELRGGQFLPSSASGCAASKAAEELTNLPQRKSRVFREDHDPHAVESFLIVRTPPTGAARHREKSDFFVVADRGGRQSRTPSQFTDGH
jgi:hypothetical protein